VRRGAGKEEDEARRRRNRKKKRDYINERRKQPIKKQEGGRMKGGRRKRAVAPYWTSVTHREGKVGVGDPSAGRKDGLPIGGPTCPTFLPCLVTNSTYGPSSVFLLPPFFMLLHAQTILYL
jgi:hypothetical protein